MEIKRRDFLKLTGLLGAGFFGRVNINEADPYNVWKPIIPDQLDKSETVCPLCQSFCRLEVLKKRELIFGLYKKDDTAGICPKISAYHNIIYGENRIKTPLLRVKERGTFSFKPIDYDAALEILKTKLQKTNFYTDAVASGEAERFYLSAISEKINFVPDNRLKSLTGAEKVYFDIENATLVVNFKTDLLSDGNFIERANHLAEKGKKFISLTPVITKGTALGEEWYPIKFSELPQVIIRLKDAVTKGADGGAPFINEIAKRIKSEKSVCLTFSPAILEFAEGVSAVSEIISFANSLKIINKPGGIYFYNLPVNSRPFNIFNDKIEAYLAYGVDTTLLYPCQDTLERLKKIPFIMYMGQHHSDISLFADLILPVPFFVEKREAYIKRDKKGVRLVKTDFAVEGGVESQELRKKENIEVIFQKLLNFKAPYGIKGLDEVARVLKSSLPTLQSYLSSLDKKVGVSNVTPSITVKPDYLIEAKDVELFLTQNLLDYVNQGSKWAEEIDSRNSILVNENTANKLKIKKGDTVVIKTAKGGIKGKVFIFEGVADDTLALNRFKKKMAVGSPYKIMKKTKDKETSLIWWKDQSVEL